MLARILRQRLTKSFSTYNRIEVSGSAIRGNVQWFSLKTGLHVAPVLKSNAYGHGIEQIVSAFSAKDIPYVAVDGYFEALRVRKVSKTPVLIMGMIKSENISKLKYRDFSFVVHDVDTIMALGKTGRRINVHLEINTGMNRYGISPKDAVGYCELIANYPNLCIDGVMSHLADSDGHDQSTVDEATMIFDESVAEVLSTGATPKYIHLAQTAGSLKTRSKYQNTMRLGIGLYGISPFESGSHPELDDLKPALKLISTITEIHDLLPGDKVGYNYTFTAPKAMRVGVLPLGYYEGLSRSLCNVGVVKIGDKYVSVTGRVCMNHTMINLDGTDAQVGDKVIVYSDQKSDKNSIESVAEAHDLFAYELLTSLSTDVRRVVLDR